MPESGNSKTLTERSYQTVALRRFVASAATGARGRSSSPMRCQMIAGLFQSPPGLPTERGNSLAGASLRSEEPIQGTGRARALASIPHAGPLFHQAAL